MAYCFAASRTTVERDNHVIKFMDDYNTYTVKLCANSDPTCLFSVRNDGKKI